MAHVPPSEAPPKKKSDEPSAADSPSVPKAPWFNTDDLRNPQSELAARLAVQSGITPNPGSPFAKKQGSAASDSSFADTPDWALRPMFGEKRPLGRRLQG
ncbi:protein of unknown function [Methylacidimicrobium sp. AP8]|nr:protein of unknown function [Methylacidimicrobium sp. AP8]